VTSERDGVATNGDAPLADDPLRETLVSSEVLRQSRILEFRIDTIEAADGHRSTRDIAAHPGGVCVVAIDPEDRVLFVRQWRHATGGPLLEIPAGTLDRLEDGSIEEHAGAAARELEEETGVTGVDLAQLAAYGAPDRDPRQRTVSVAHLGVLPEPVPVTAGDDAAEAGWYDVHEVLARADELAFDHGQVLRDALDRVRAG